MRSRKPGAKRSTCASMRSTMPVGPAARPAARACTPTPCACPPARASGRRRSAGRAAGTAGRRGRRAACLTERRNSSSVPADVHRAGAAHVRVLPRDRAVERPVDLDRRRRRGRSVLQRGASTRPGRSAMRRAARRGITSAIDDRGREALVGGRDAGHAARRRSARARPRAPVRISPPRRAQVGDERVGQALGAAARARPADGVAEQVQVEGGDRAAGAVRRRVAVHRGAVEPGARAAVLEQPLAEARPPSRAACRANSSAAAVRRRAAAAARRSAGSRRASWRARRRSASRNGALNSAQRSPSPRAAAACASSSRGTAAPPRRRAAGARSRRPGAPTRARARQRHAREHRRRGARRVDRGERVVAEAGQRQLLGAHGAAGRVGGLEHEHRAPGLGEPDRGREPVRARADDHGVAHAASRLARAGAAGSARASSPWPQNACWASLPATL